MLKHNPTTQDVRKVSVHKLRVEKRKRKVKRIKTKALDNATGIGTLYHVKTMTGLAPYNSHGNTDYLVGRGITCIGEKTRSGFRLYLTGGRLFHSIEELKAAVGVKIPQTVIARRSELKVGEVVVLS